VKYAFVTLALSASLLLCGSILWRVGGEIAHTSAVALGDLDGDGDLDAFLANGRSEGVAPNTVWMNDGRGRYEDSGQRLGELMSGSAVVVDLDADEDLDVLVGNRWIDPSLEILENDGRAHLITREWLRGPEEYAPGIGSVAVGDLDGDGDPDLYGATGCGHDRTGVNGSTIVVRTCNAVWLNDGAGTWVDSGQRLGTQGGKAVALGDLDGDGDLDAFVAHGPTGDSGGLDAVWLNDGRGQFVDSGQQLSDPASDGDNSLAVDLGDLDGDSDLDAYVGNEGADKVWLNDGAGRFAGSGQALGDTVTRVVTLADLDGDGDLDAFAGGERGVQTWLNDGTSHFELGPRVTGWLLNRAAAVGDVDRDGDPDVFAGSATGRPKVWLNDGTGQFHRAGVGPAWPYAALGAAILTALVILGVLKSRARLQGNSG
jgi:hypothetical protein